MCVRSLPGNYSCLTCTLRKMRAAWLLMPVALSCAPAGRLTAERTPAAVPPVAAAPEPTSAPPPRADGPNRCLPSALPKRTARKLYTPSTCADHKKAEAAIARKLAKDYDRSIKGSTVDVSFGCDPLTSDLEELVIETGYGHGGNLEVWRIKADKDGQSYEVLALGHAGYYRPKEPGDTVQIGRGRFTKAQLEKALSTARPALTAIVRELEPPPLPNVFSGRSFSTSSGNFHHYFRLFDGMHELERHFTGYPGSGDQPRYVGLQLAMEALRPLLDGVKLEADRASADERDFFVTSFLAAAPRFDDDFAWWVRDRYVRMASELGTPELVPALVEVLAHGLAEGDRETDEVRKKEVHERRLADPIATLVKITGWDPQKDETGAVRPTAAVAKDMLTECRRALAEPTGERSSGKERGSPSE